MKTLKQYIKESYSWVGCKWNSSCAISLQENRYRPFEIELVKEYMQKITTDYKWNTVKQQFVNVENLNSEDDIEEFIAQRFTNSNYDKYKFKDFVSMAKEIYDEFINDYDWVNWDENNVKTKGHPFIKNDNGEILSLEDWLKKPCDYYSGVREITWGDYFREEWEEVQESKKRSIEHLTNYAIEYLKHTISISESYLRNIKLDKDIEFGSVTSGSGRQTREAHGYLKIGEGTTEGKTLILSYTENESEALKLKTLGDLLDLLYQYTKVKLETPAGVLNTRWANAIILFPVDNKLTKAKVGIIKFR